MNSIDLTFLSECEVETIVNVVEKDFELKATEKSRLCRLRKTLIRNDQRATELSQTNVDGQYCVICSKKFIFLFNPKRICCSCNLQICRFCCRFVKMFENYICQICQKQKDVIAMNCSWFYENLKRKFKDDGSQVITNSLSDYTRKTLITPEILNMVKGTQISKFRQQLDDATRTIEESLIKVELSSIDKETKSKKYNELIQMFVEKLKQIIRNTREVLHITMDNYLGNVGNKNTNIDVEVLNTLHEEVELRIGKKIDIKMCQRKIMQGYNTLDDLDSRDNLETRLSKPILDKLLYDVQQSLMETRGKTYDDLNSTLQSMVKTTKLDGMDFDFESVSQAASIHGTSSHNNHLRTPQPSFVGTSKKSSTISKLYDMSDATEKSFIVSKHWNELLASDDEDIKKTLSDAQNTMYPFVLDDSVPVDSDALSMPTVNQSSESNWLMKARYPLSSLYSLVMDPKSLFTRSNKKEPILTIDDPVKRLQDKENRRRNSNSIDEIYQKNLTVLSSLEKKNSIDQIYQKNRNILSDPNNVDISQIYLRNCDDVKLQGNIDSRKDLFTKPSSTKQIYNSFSKESPTLAGVRNIGPSSAPKEIPQKMVLLPQQSVSKPTNDTLSEKLPQLTPDRNRGLTSTVKLVPPKMELPAEAFSPKQNNNVRFYALPKSTGERGVRPTSASEVVPSKLGLLGKSPASKQNETDVSLDHSKANSDRIRASTLSPASKQNEINVSLEHTKASSDRIRASTLSPALKQNEMDVSLEHTKASSDRIRGSTLQPEVILRKKPEVNKSMNDSTKPKPDVPLRKSEILRLSTAPSIPKRKSYASSSPTALNHDNTSDSPKDLNQKSKISVAKSKRN